MGNFNATGSRQDTLSYSTRGGGKHEQTAAQHFIEEGREIGAIEAMQRTLIEQMSLKFDSISQQVLRRIQTLRDINQLTPLLRRIITASTLQEMGIE